MIMSVIVVCSTVATVYAISSFVFLRRPQWLHRIRRPAFIVRNIGHRGGAAEGHENSLHAFDKGLTNGMQMIELDCHLTKDHQTIVHHDASVDRTTGQPGFIRDIEYDNLPKIQKQLQLYYDSDVKISDEVDDELLRIPLLKEVFQRYPTIPINIDVKENNDILIKQVSDLIEEYHREDITYWGSFNDTICQKLTVQNPRIVRFCSMKEAAKIVAAYWFGLLPFLRITPGAFEVPVPGEVFRKFFHNFNWKYRLILYLAERALNNQKMFMHLQRRGIPVYVWILNNDQEFAYAFNDLSVTGIMTDRPSLLKLYLETTEQEHLL